MFRPAVLFYTQIKKEFSHASWRRGQIYFREERVRDVRLDGEVIVGKVQGTEKSPYEAAIQAGRGTIQNSKCSCPAHRQYESHCKHVAALAIWAVERGSLLRSGLGGAEHGIAVRATSSPTRDEVVFGDPQRAMADARLRALLRAHPVLAGSRFVIRKDLRAGSIEGRDAAGYPFSIPITLIEANALGDFVESPTSSRPTAIPGEAVLYVRGLFQSKVFNALTAESAIRYEDPVTHAEHIHTLSYLTKQADPGIWKTTQGVLLYVPPVALQEGSDSKPVSFVQHLDTHKIIFQGAAAVDNLAKFLTHRNKNEIVFEAGIHVPVENTPLRLVALHIGERIEGQNTRRLNYEFEGAGMRIGSDGLEELAKYGKLGNEYVWVADRIYKLGISFPELKRYSNRSGIEVEEGERDGGPPTGFGQVFDHGDSPLHPLAAYRLSLEMGVANLTVDDTWGDFHSWRKIFEKKRIPSLPKVEYGFHLREYQKNGLNWLWSLYHRGISGLLADEMGLGKTHQVLALLTSVYSTKPKVKQPSLVVAPTSVISAWAQKLSKYNTGLKWHVYHGSGRKLPTSGVDIILTTYGILHREEALREREWHIAILDEAQAIKNAGTISSRASRALKARFRVAMTGTPVENHAGDLWSLMEFLLPGYLGSLARFKRLYGWGRDLPAEAQSQALKRMISPFLLRRTKSQVLTELPEKTEEVLHCEMTPEQRKAYRETLNGTDARKARDDLEAGKKIDYANILALLTRLKQICDHPKLASLTQGKIKKIKSVDPSESGKWDAFEELLEEALGSNLKVVVFTQYLSMMDLIGEHLKSKEVGFTELRGDTADRGKRLDKFASDPECKVFICSLLAGGLGIDLTSASVCIHFDRWWNPAKENQATDRLHRFGQTRGVQVFKLQIPGTVEDRIASIIETKKQLSGALIEESSVGLKAFSRKDLLDLLSIDSVPATTSAK
jgi:superfamily II DNA or RNA helicase